MSFLSWLFNLVISSLRSPFAISVFIQFDLVSVFVKTIFGVSTIFLADAFQGSPSLFILLDQCEIKSSTIFRPIRMVSTDSAISSIYFMQSSLQINQSISLLGPAIQPSTEISTCSFNFLITFLLLFIYVRTNLVTFELKMASRHII